MQWCCQLICLTRLETRYKSRTRLKVMLGEPAWPSHSVDTAPVAAAAAAAAQELELALPVSVRSISFAALGWRRYGQALHRATRTVHGGPSAWAGLAACRQLPGLGPSYVDAPFALVLVRHNLRRLPKACWDLKHCWTC